MKIFGNVPNLLINGDMAIAQRRSSATSPSAAPLYWTVDRWAVWFNNVGSMTSPETSRSSLPGGFPGVTQTNTALRMVSNVVGASGQYNFRQRIESIRLHNLTEDRVSYGFWGWFSNFQNLRIELFQPTAVDNYTAETSLGFINIPVVDSQWHFYEIKDLSLLNTNGIACVASLQSPSNGAGLADAYVTETMCNEGARVERFKLAGVHPDIELQLCQRYFEKSYNIDAAVGSTGQPGAYTFIKGVSDLARHGPSFRVTKRTIPVTTVYHGSTGANGFFGTEFGDSIAPNQSNGNSQRQFIINVTIGAGSPWTTRAFGTPCGFHWTADAEL
jgi:hypothetical protein